MFLKTVRNSFAKTPTRYLGEITSFFSKEYQEKHYFAVNYLMTKH